MLRLWLGGCVYDALGSSAWTFIGGLAISVGEVTIALTFRPPHRLAAAVPGPSVAH